MESQSDMELPMEDVATVTKGLESGECYGGG